MSYGNEYKTSEELLEGLQETLDQVIETLEQGLGDIFDALVEKMEPVGKEFSSSNTKKSMGSLEKFGKSLKAAPQVFILEQLMKLLEPFLMLLEPIATIFDILSGLLSVFTAEIMKAMFEGLQPLFDILISLMPIFKVLGQLFAEIVKIGMIPMKVILELITAILEPFLPLFNRLSELFEELGPIFDIVTIAMTLFIKAGLLPVLLSVYGIARGIATLVDFITGIIDAIDFLNVTPVRGTTFGSEVDKFFLPILADFIGLQSGGVVGKEGLYRLAEGNKKEIVTPLDQFTKMIQPPVDETHFIEMKEIMQEQLVIQKKQARGINKRRFG